MQDLEAVIAGSSTLENVHAKSLAHFIEVCLRCAVSCTACADECLDEPDITRLRRSIRLDLDCADVCGTVARLLARRGEPDLATLRAALETCIDICTACAAENQKHADEFEHCKLTAELVLNCGREAEAALSSTCDVPSA
jgi:hypothetical protein